MSGRGFLGSASTALNMGRKKVQVTVSSTPVPSVKDCMLNNLEEKMNRMMALAFGSDE